MLNLKWNDKVKFTELQFK